MTTFIPNDSPTTESSTLSLHDALPIFSTNLASHFFDLVIGKILTSRLSLSKHLAHNLGNLLLLGKIGVFHNRRNASSRLLLLIRSEERRVGKEWRSRGETYKGETNAEESTREAE